MKKSVMQLGLALGLFIGSSSSIAAASNDNVKVVVDGEAVSFGATTKPFIEQGHTLIALRPVLEMLDAVVKWEDSTVFLQKGVRNISLKPNQKESDVAIINGAERPLPVPAKIVDGRTFIPVRFVSEYFRATVNWDTQTRTVYIENRKLESFHENMPTYSLVTKDDHTQEIIVDGKVIGSYYQNEKSHSISLHDVSTESFNEAYYVIVSDLAAENGFPMTKDEILNLPRGWKMGEQGIPVYHVKNISFSSHYQVPIGGYLFRWWQE